MKCLMQLRHGAFIKDVASRGQKILQFAKLCSIAIIAITTLIESIACMEVQIKLAYWKMSKLLKNKTPYSVLSCTPFVIIAWNINILVFVINNTPTAIKE